MCQSSDATGESTTTSTTVEAESVDPSSTTLTTSTTTTTAPDLTLKGANPSKISDVLVPPDTQKLTEAIKSSSSTPPPPPPENLG